MPAAGFTSKNLHDDLSPHVTYIARRMLPVIGSNLHTRCVGAPHIFLTFLTFILTTSLSSIILIRIGISAVQSQRPQICLWLLYDIQLTVKTGNLLLSRSPVT